MPKIKRRPSKSAKSAKREKFNIDRAREEYEIGSLERLVAEAKNYREFDDIAREHTNAKNRAKTQFGKAFKQLVLNEEIEIGDRLEINDVAFFYDYATSERIDPKALYKLWKDGDISEEVFFNCISVTKEKAQALIGGLMLDPIIERKVGDKLDVRKEDLDKPIAEEFIIKPKKPKPGRVKKTQQDPVAKATGTSRKPTRRRIKVKR